LIDYIFLSNSCWLRERVIIVSAINLSDHLPVKMVCRIGVAINSDNVAGLSNVRPNFKNNFALLDFYLVIYLFFQNHCYKVIRNNIKQ